MILKKNKLLLSLVFIITVFTFNLKSFALTLPELSITSNNYLAENKMTLEETYDVAIGNTLQLYAIIQYGNDFCPDDLDECGLFVKETNLSGVTWTSSNTEAATVDNTGKVTAISEGKVTITAKYNNETANYEVNVIVNTENTYFSITMRVKTEGGTITSEQGLVGGATSVEKGKDLKIYLIPDEGYEIDKVLVDNNAIDLKTLVYEKNNPNAASKDGVAVYTFTNISKDYTIEVFYKIKSNSTTLTDKSGNVTVNPKTGTILIAFACIIGLSSIGYAFWHFKKYNKTKDD